MERTGANKAYDLSIVIVSYNTLDMTRECLASILQNTGQLAVQVIVVDNNSLDGTIEMIRSEFPEITLIENSDNRGFAAANNQAFPLCRGEYILLLNSDTIVLDSVLEDSVDYLRCNPLVGAMGCQVLNADRTIQRTCSGFPTLGRLLLMTLAVDKFPFLSFLDHYLMRSWRRGDEREVEVISGCFLMVRKEVLERVGPLDENFFFFGEETDWCRRMRRAGWKLVFTPVGRIVHHGGGSVRKLNHKRDVLLTAATVRLHRKHGGVLAGMLAYVILMLFNLTRAGGWSIAARFTVGGQARAQHFIKVSLAYRECWPE